MKFLPNDFMAGVKFLAGIVIFFFLWAVFVWFGWNGFIVPVFGAKHLSYSAAAGATLLWWMVFFTMLAMKELAES